MLESVNAAPPDAILGIVEAFKADSNPDKINLSVGVYQDDTGTTPILECVKAAEARILDNESTKSYLGMDGSPEFRRLSAELLFGADHEAVTGSRATVVQAPGGTGALRVAADFIKTNLPGAEIWCSLPTWPNHPKIFGSAGLNVQNYDYFSADLNGLDFDAYINSISQIPAGNVICLHACCHNPTGADLTAEQWKQTADVVYDRGLLPLLDFAYLGFGQGLVEDSVAVREMTRLGCELMIANSFSKNFGLYRERIGALTTVAKDADQAKCVLSQQKANVRSNYSNPPSHGGAIVTTVLGDSELRTQWEVELAGMRDRINGIRARFTQGMNDQNTGKDFGFISDQCGMFSFSGLTPLQVDELRNQHSIYMVRNGRINVAGIRESNVERLCSAIASVL